MGGQPPPGPGDPLAPAQPDDLETLLARGQALLAAGNPAAAADPLLSALLLHPDSADAHGWMGRALRALGHWEEALHCLHSALRLRPQDPDLELQQGRVLGELGRFEEAAASFTRAVEGNPGLLDAWANLGAAQHILGDLEGSAEASKRALELDPEHANARCNLGLVQLLQGDYGNGLANVDDRFRRAGGLGLLKAQPPCERWQGEGLPIGQPLLLVCEQGLGDTVQFMRYLPRLRRQGLEVEFCAQEPLHGLIRQSRVDPAPLSPEQANGWNRGTWLPLLSLLRLLGVQAHEPLETGPYLPVPEARRQFWHDRLADEPRPIIGIHWQGDPRQETTGLRGRSLPLAQFEAVAAACGDGRLLALQKGPGAEQMESCPFREQFVACQEQIDQAWDFLDAVALIACCDLVISSDSCLAHLAGAMGHPTWLLLAQVPDWRWGLAGERSAWYPSMRLFRQRQAGDWAELMERVAAALPARGSGG